jgi:hypothetical protein
MDVSMASALKVLDTLQHRHLIRLWRDLMDQQDISRPSIFASSDIAAARASYISYKDCKRLTDSEKAIILSATKRQLSDWTADEIFGLIKKTRPSDTVPPTGRLRGADAPARGEIARLLQLADTSQEEFHDLCAGLNGRYLIFRLVRATNHLLVSFMRIAKPSEKKLVATFTTLRPARVAADERTVQGIIYCSGSGISSRVFSIGRLINSSQIRTTSLLMQPRRSNDGGMRHDLIGIRLGLGAINQKPRAYRIWCYQLRKKRDRKFLRTLLGRFSLKDEAVKRQFEGQISNFNQILEYLNAGHDAAVGDD